MGKKKDYQFFPVHMKKVRNKIYKGDHYYHIVKDVNTNWQGSVASFLCKNVQHLSDGTFIMYVREDHKFIEKMKLLTREEREQLKERQVA